MKPYQAEKNMGHFKWPRRVGTLFFIHYFPSMSQKLQRLSAKRALKKAARFEAKKKLRHFIENETND